MVKNFICARDARVRAETSEKLVNQLFKNIKDAADYGQCTLDFDVFNVSEALILDMRTVLNDAGYRVDLVCDDYDVPQILTVCW